MKLSVPSPFFLLLFFFTLIHVWEGWGFSQVSLTCLLAETSAVSGNQ